MYSSAILNPILVLAGAAVVSAAVARLVKTWAGGLVAIAGVVYCLVWALGSATAGASAPSQGLGAWMSASGLQVQLSFLVDTVSAMSMIPLLAGVLVALFYSLLRDLAGDGKGWHSYPLQILSLTGLLAIMLGANLVVVCAGWGVFVVAGYALLVSYGLRPEGRSGAGTFLAIGSIAGFALLGACTLLVRFGGGALDWAAIPEPAFRSDFFWLLAVALLAMTAQYPFHGLSSRTTARIYPQVSVIVSVGPVMTALYLFLRVQMLAAPGSGLSITGLFLLFGTVTAAGGAILALTSDSPGAVAGFANTSLSGFAVLSMGIGTAMGTSATLFIMACLPLLVVATAMAAKSEDERAEDTMAHSPASSHRAGTNHISGYILLALAMGLPFGAGFIVRWLVIAALVDAGSLFYAAIAFLASV
ncbi:MAG: hypothetical protein M1319_07300, partial [Chloroflexi bacterium]|nr:hypothetical protein [Chloroflexota bacterium]